MRIVFSLAICVGLVFGQAGAPRRPSMQTPKGWKAPRTPDGVPDLQGMWTNVTITPLQRPANVSKAVFTEAEAQAFEKETVARIERLLYVAEYKRRQAPPGVKLGIRNFGRDRRYPITNAFRTI